MSDETIYEKLKHSLVIMKLKDLGVNTINISFSVSGSDCLINTINYMYISKDNNSRKINTYVSSNTKNNINKIDDLIESLAISIFTSYNAISSSFSSNVHDINGMLVININKKSYDLSYTKFIQEGHNYLDQKLLI
tara:strand:+ start:715 stop:1122 length:408 start_codon:yes stop_codon:yes gene_type:complete